MSHISGFDGSIGGDLISAGELGLKIEAFDMEQDTDVIEARAKGEAWYTRWTGASKWSGTIEFLVNDATVALALSTNQVISNLEFILKSGTTDLTLIGSGYLTNLKVSSPIDGPAKGTATLTGDGAVTETLFT